MSNLFEEISIFRGIAYEAAKKERFSTKPWSIEYALQKLHTVKKLCLACHKALDSLNSEFKQRSASFKDGEAVFVKMMDKLDLEIDFLLNKSN